MKYITLIKCKALINIKEYFSKHYKYHDIVNIDAVNEIIYWKYKF